MGFLTPHKGWRGLAHYEDCHMLSMCTFDHRADSVIEFIALENYALNYLSKNIYEMTMNDNKPIPENLVVVH